MAATAIEYLRNSSSFLRYSHSSEASLFFFFFFFFFHHHHLLLLLERGVCSLVPNIPAISQHDLNIGLKPSTPEYPSRLKSQLLAIEEEKFVMSVQFH